MGGEDKRKGKQSLYVFFYLCSLDNGGLYNNERRRHMFSSSSAVNLPTLFLHLLFCPFTWVPQLRLSFVPEAHTESVVCVIPPHPLWISTESSEGSEGRVFGCFLIKRCLHLMCCRSTDRLDRILLDDCDGIDEDDTFSLYMYIDQHQKLKFQSS